MKPVSYHNVGESYKKPVIKVQLAMEHLIKG